jgi:hypothetical protein
VRLKEGASARQSLVAFVEDGGEGLKHVGHTTDGSAGAEDKLGAARPSTVQLQLGLGTYLG